MRPRLPLRAVSALLGTVLGLSAFAAPPGPAAAGEWQVVGGAPVEDGRWPAMVALVRAEDPDPVSGQFCGATLVAPDLVLTAAHCFHTTTGRLSRGPADVHAVVGATSLADPAAQRVPTTELFVHPDYAHHSFTADVALLRLAQPVDAPSQPLAEAGTGAPEAGTVSVILGWGRTGTATGDASARTDVLHEANVTVHSAQACSAAFTPSPDPSVHACAGGMGTSEQPVADACRGDSGGPLLLPVEGGPALQIGITSYGPAECGVEDPGVYTLTGPARGWIDEVIAGSVAPVDPPDDDGAGPSDPLRIAAGSPVTEPITQAVASSQAVFADGAAGLAVIAREDTFPDGLSGSALLFGRGPLLFTSPTGPLAEATRAELRRAVAPGSTVYLLGGAAAVPAEVEDAVVDLGLVPQRLFGTSRQETAAAVAREVIDRFGTDGRPPFGTVVLATSGAWADAVLAGQLSAWWGYPLLLTGPDQLHPAAEAVLRDHRVERIIIVGGAAAVSDLAATQADLASGARLVRLGGPSRVETGLAIAQFQVEELARQHQPPPDTVLAVNIRREDGFTHVLSAAPILAATAGVYVPVEGEDGSLITYRTERTICGLGGAPLGIGGTDVVTDEALAVMATQLTQQAC